MDIDQRDLEEFVRLFEEEFGEKVSIDETTAMAQRVILLCEHLMEPLPEKKEST